MAIVYPHVFQDGVNEPASGVQVNDNFNTIKGAVEAEEAARAALGAQLGTLKIKVGTATATFAGGVTSTKVTHGLGVAPKWANALIVFGGSVYFGIHFVGVKSSGSTETEFTIAQDSGVVIADGATALIWWIVVG